MGFERSDDGSVIGQARGVPNRVCRPDLQVGREVSVCDGRAAQTADDGGDAIDGELDVRFGRAAAESEANHRTGAVADRTDRLEDV
jgi:hypothetical protein